MFISASHVSITSACHFFSICVNQSLNIFCKGCCRKTVMFGQATPCSIYLVPETYYQKHTACWPTSRGRVPCVLRLLRTNKYACMLMSCLIYVVIWTKLSVLSLCVCYMATIYTSRELTCSNGQLLMFTSTTPAYYRVTSIQFHKHDELVNSVL